MIYIIPYLSIAISNNTYICVSYYSLSLSKYLSIYINESRIKILRFETWCKYKQCITTLTVKKSL